MGSLASGDCPPYQLSGPSQGSLGTEASAPQGLLDSGRASCPCLSCPTATPHRLTVKGAHLFIWAVPELRAWVLGPALLIHCMRLHEGQVRNGHGASWSHAPGWQQRWRPGHKAPPPGLTSQCQENKRLQTHLPFASGRRNLLVCRNLPYRVKWPVTQSHCQGILQKM